MIFSNLEDLLTVMDKASQNNLSETLPFKECEFIFIKATTPYIYNTLTGSKMLISSDWIKKQLCSIFGVSTTFYNRNPAELSELVYRSHSQLVSDDSSDMYALLHKNAITGDTEIRGLIPLNYTIMGLTATIRTLRDKLEHKFLLNKIHHSSSDFIFDPVIEFVAYSTDTTIKFGDIDLHPGFYLRTSEIGGVELTATPMYVSDTGVCIPVLDEKRRMLMKHKFCYIKDQETVTSAFTSMITQNNDIFDYDKNPISVINSKDVFKFDVALNTLEDWSTRKGFPSTVYKKCINHIDAWLATREENNLSTDFDSESHFVAVILSALESEPLKTKMKVGMFVSSRYGILNS